MDTYTVLLGLRSAFDPLGSSTTSSTRQEVSVVGLAESMLDVANHLTERLMGQTQLKVPSSSPTPLPIKVDTSAEEALKKVLGHSLF